MKFLSVAIQMKTVTHSTFLLILPYTVVINFQYFQSVDTIQKCV